MQQRDPVDLGNGVWMIDLMEQGLPFRTAGYLILDEKITLVETGSALSHEPLLAGMAAVGVRPEDLSYVIVTHVHLDHAGGAGHLMAKAPNATLVAHPRAGRHMIDPSRLWRGAEAVYGEKLEKWFGSILPVPAERVLIRDHGETLNIGRRTLTFFDSPGHAKHHFTILDPVAEALYAGDALGIRYRTGFTGWDKEWIWPSTSPVDFDPDAVRRTAAMLEDVPFRFVYHGHFGPSPKDEAIRETVRGAEAFAELAREVCQAGGGLDEMVDALRDWMLQDLRRQGLDPDPALAPLSLDLLLDSMGLLHYAQQLQNEKR
jgi:glyoxylase-like metal-dependent hydrolase (beta-lactamase superfamily II)